MTGGVTALSGDTTCVLCMFVGRSRTQNVSLKKENISKRFEEHRRKHDVDSHCSRVSIELVSHEYEVRWRTLRSRISSTTSRTFANFNSYTISLESKSVMMPGSRAKEMKERGE